MKYLVCEINNSKVSNITKQIKSILLIIVLIFTTVNQYATAGASAVTTGSKVNGRIDYIEEVAVITKGTGNSTKFYMSTDEKTWEMIESNGLVDISTMLTTKEANIYFKGNKDTESIAFTLQAEDKNLKVTYKIVNGDGKIEFNTSLPVEFRKGANGSWKPAVNLMATSIYEIKGATLYFRTSATTIKRAGKTITLKIAKRPSAPSVKLDGGKLCITGLKLGETQYRVGDSTNWIDFTSLDPKMKSLELYKLLGGSATTNTPIPAGVIEFRNLGSAKKITSSIKVIEIPLQQPVPNVISVTGTALTIRDTDIKKAYEYTKVEKNSTLNMNTAIWTTVTSKNTVVIKNIAVGDKVLVRVKSSTDKTSKQIIPASTYKEIVITTITVNAR